MRIISIHIGLKTGEKDFIFLRKAYELGFIPFYKRSFAKSPLDFAARTCLQRVRQKETVKVKLEDVEGAWMFAHVNLDKIGVSVICDSEYPDPAAKKVIIGVIKSFTEKFTIGQILDQKVDTSMEFAELNKMIKLFQDPKEADKLMKIEKELDEIQVMLTKTLNDLLERGEKLDELAKTSEDISDTSYNFYKNAKKANSRCCSLY